MSDPFPSEIWVQILRRVPPKYLVKCTCVCKAWKSLITEHAFICDHLTHSNQASNRNASLFLQIYRKKRLPNNNDFNYAEYYSLYSDHEEIDHPKILRFPLTRRICFFPTTMVVNTCNGLVCFANYSVYDIADHVIWNPSIRKYMVLPKPNLTFADGPTLEETHRVIYGFGFDSRNKDFKLVRLVTLMWKEATPQVEVYSLASGSWRTITATAPSYCYKHFLDVERTSQMFMNGLLHWVVQRTSNGQNHYFILTFDVSEETFGELMLPQCLKESPFKVSILAGGDCLAVIHRHVSDLDDYKFFSVWVMKEYGDMESWTQVFHYELTENRGISSVFALTRSGEVVLRSMDGIVLLDPMTELVKKLGIRGFFKAFVGYYVPSLFLINKEASVLSY